jgi:hypothetical protein
MVCRATHHGYYDGGCGLLLHKRVIRQQWRSGSCRLGEVTLNNQYGVKKQGYVVSSLQRPYRNECEPDSQLRRLWCCRNRRFTTSKQRAPVDQASVGVDGACTTGLPTFPVMDTFTEWYGYAVIQSTC